MNNYARVRQSLALRSGSWEMSYQSLAFIVLITQRIRELVAKD